MDKVEYICIKQFEIKDLDEYNNYFVVGSIYTFIKDYRLSTYPYTHYNNNKRKNLNEEELNIFFINKKYSDREVLINKILEND
jgi:hypothetical protein